MKQHILKTKNLKVYPLVKLANVLSSQSTFIPIIMMMIIMMAGQLVISSMALEKENKTLETLLTLPVKRLKYCCRKNNCQRNCGLILAVIYMLGMSSYLTSFQFQGTTSGVASFDLSLSGH